MLRSYLKTAFRNFRRNKITSFINLLGLSLGLASCLIAGLYIKHELSADQFHKGINSIYRVTVKMKDYNMSGTPYLFSETAGKDFSSIKSSLRTASEQGAVKINNDKFNHEIVFADPNFFTFFSFTLQQGNAKQALDGLQKVVISNDIRKKYFPSLNPVGQIIQIKLKDEYTDFEITGVADPAPAYSSINFDFLIPLENKYGSDQKSKDNWSAFFLTTFIKVDEVDIEGLENAMPGFVKKYMRESKNADGSPEMNFVMNSFARHHLREGFPGGGLTEGRSPKGLYVFSGIAVLILLLACFNFMNLTNAQSSRRIIEVGIRKVIGAGKLQLIRQFLCEALMLSLFAAILSLGIAELSLFFFRDILQASLSVFDRQHVDIYLGLTIITAVAGLLAGCYPALVLSNLSVVNTFKRYLKIGGSNLLTRSVLSIQFVLSIILIICAMVMWKQQQYMMNKDLGYNKEQIFVLPVSNSDTASIEILKDEIKRHTEIVSVANSSGSFTRGNNVSIQRMQDHSSMFIYMISIDNDYIPVMGMKVVKGEAFADDHIYDDKTIMINEALMKKLNIEDSIGVRLGRTIGWMEHPVVLGVVKNFHHQSLQSEIEPMMFLHEQPLNNSYLMIRLASGQLINGMKKIQDVWEKFIPDSPFEYFFLDDDIAKQYSSELRWSRIITLATGMAIFLSVLGLVGLAMYTAEQRKKEIGIRKVMGASLHQIITLLSKDYMWLIATAFLIAVPASYYVMMHYWLDNFAFRIKIDFPIYLMAFLIVLIIVAFAIGSQTIRAAMQNPAETLKEE